MTLKVIARSNIDIILKIQHFEGGFQRASPMTFKVTLKVTGGEVRRSGARLRTRRVWRSSKKANVDSDVSLFSHTLGQWGPTMPTCGSHSSSTNYLNWTILLRLMSPDPKQVLWNSEFSYQTLLLTYLLTSLFDLLPHISAIIAPIVTKFYVDNPSALGTEPTEFDQNRKRFRGTSGFF